MEQDKRLEGTVRMRRILGLLVAALFVLGLVTTPATAQNAGTNDYSSGFGFLDDPENRGSVGYELIALTPVSSSPAQGQFDFRRATRDGQGIGFHALGVCIDAEGDEAVLGLQVDESTDPAYEEGEFLEAVALDASDGNGGARNGDKFNMDEESTTEEADCETDQEPTSNIRGDIVVQDGGFGIQP
jgi:hypothetical protein